MTALTAEQLEELVTTINNRLREFGPGVFDILTYGVVRLVYGVICEKQEVWWQAEQGGDVADYANARKEAFARGYAAGLGPRGHPGRLEVEEIDPGPDFDGGFYTRTPDGAPKRESQVATAGTVIDPIDSDHPNPLGYPYIDDEQLGAMALAARDEIARLSGQAAVTVTDDGHGLHVTFPQVESDTDTDDDIIGYISDPATVAAFGAVLQAIAEPQNDVEKLSYSTDAPKGHPDTAGILDTEESFDERTAQDAAFQRAPTFEAQIQAPKTDEKLTNVPPLSDAAAAPGPEGTPAPPLGALGPEHTPAAAARESYDAGSGERVTPPKSTVGNGRFLTLPNPDQARENVAAALAAAKGDPDFDFTPRVNGGRPAAIHTPKASSDQAKARSVSYRQIIGELKRMAVGTKDMPTMAQWNESKPAHFPQANSICYKHNVGWVDLAKDAGLKMKKRGKVTA